MLEMTRLLRIPEVENVLGLKKSAIYNMVNEGLLTKPIKMGRKVSLWPDYEVQAIVEAIIENREEKEMKSIVEELMGSRISRL